MCFSIANLWSVIIIVNCIFSHAMMQYFSDNRGYLIAQSGSGYRVFLLYLGWSQLISHPAGGESELRDRRINEFIGMSYHNSDGGRAIANERDGTRENQHTKMLRRGIYAPRTRTRVRGLQFVDIRGR